MKIVLVVILLGYSLVSQSQEWKTLPNSPTVEGRFDDIYFINDSTGWAVNGLGEIYKTNAPGQQWSLQFSNARRKYIRSIEFIDDTTGFAGSLDSALYKTTNSGKTWNRVDKDFPVPVPGICGISHFGDAVILTGAFFGYPFVINSSDRGKTWSYVDMSNNAIALVDAWYKSKDTVFVSGKNHSNQCLIMRSVDAGKTWSTVSPSDQNVPLGFGWKLHFPTPSVGYLAIEEVDVTDSPIGNKTHILKSTDGGRSWSPHEVKIGKNIDLQGIGFSDANRGWIGGWSTGMYETNDGGVTWKLINNFSNLNRFFFLRGNFGYAVGNVVLQFRKAVITGVEPQLSTSHDIHKLEIYPNPATTKSMVRVSLGIRTMMVLSLYDAMGRTIKEIYKGYSDEGVHEFPVDLENLSNGDYIVVLLTNEHFLGRKLVKVKN